MSGTRQSHKKFDFNAQQQAAAEGKRKRSRSRSQSPEHGVKAAQPWSLVDSESLSDSPELQISSQILLNGTFSFRVKDGIIDCMGYIVSAHELNASEPNKKKNVGKKHIKSNDSSASAWINVVSGDAQRRHGASLLLPILNLSGKSKQAKIEIREWQPDERTCLEDLARCNELNGLRGARIIENNNFASLNGGDAKFSFSAKQANQSPTDRLFVQDPSWSRLKLDGFECQIVLGPQNSGKSTLCNFLLNRLRSARLDHKKTQVSNTLLQPLKEDNVFITRTKIFLLDVDCGQPTFNMPGSISLLHCLETASSEDARNLSPVFEPYSQTFINSANPAADPGRYLAIISEKINIYKAYQSDDGSDKKLVINTCGWVEGLGAEIQQQIVELAQEILNGSVQVIQLSSTAKQSDIQLPHEKYHVLTVKGDLHLGNAQFSRGSVLRNYRLFDEFAPVEMSRISGKYSAETGTVAQYHQALTFLCQRKPVKVAFTPEIKFIMTEGTVPADKFALLQYFNLQIVACLELKDCSEPPAHWVSGSKEGVSYTSIAHAQDERITQEFFEADNDLLFYAYVRDIHYNEGLHLIVPSSLSEAQLQAKLARITAIVPCNPKLFSLPQSFIMKAEVVEDLLSSQNVARSLTPNALDANESDAQQVKRVKHILTDLLL